MHENNDGTGYLGCLPESKEATNSRDIWSEAEIPEGGHGEDEFDPRPAPE